MCIHTYIYTHGCIMEYYSAIKKKNEISLLGITWMETEDESRGYYAK